MIMVKKTKRTARMFMAFILAVTVWVALLGIVTYAFILLVISFMVWDFTGILSNSGITEPVGILVRICMLMLFMYLVFKSDELIDRFNKD